MNNWIDFTEKEKACLYSAMLLIVRELAGDPMSLIDKDTFLRTKNKAFEVQKDMFATKSPEEIVGYIKNDDEFCNIMRNMSISKKDRFFNLLIVLYEISPNAKYGKRMIIYKFCEYANYRLLRELSI